MTKHGLRSGCALIALGIAAQTPAWAQTAPSAPAATTATAADPGSDPAQVGPAQADPAQAEPVAGTDIIVTGSAREQRRFDVSYAVNSLSNADIQKLAPLNFADLLGKGSEGEGGGEGREGEALHRSSSRGVLRPRKTSDVEAYRVRPPVLHGRGRKTRRGGLPTSRR